MGDLQGRPSDSTLADTLGGLRAVVKHLDAVEQTLSEKLRAEIQRQAGIAFARTVEGADESLREREELSKTAIQQLLLRLGEVTLSRAVIERELSNESESPAGQQATPDDQRVVPLRLATLPTHDPLRWSTAFWEGGQPKAAQAAVAILQRHPNEPVRVRQIVSEIVTEGWLSDYLNPRNAVTSALNRLRDDPTAPVDSPQRGFFRWIGR